MGPPIVISNAAKSFLITLPVDTLFMLFLLHNNLLELMGIDAGLQYHLDSFSC